VKAVFVVGAGPAGLFAAQKIALAGHQVIVFNRDIKPGGLAEYGIYPVKDKMKTGLRKQFSKVLGLPNVHYFGNVPVGQAYSITIDELRQFNPSAIVFAVGAQGTKKLGLPGEDAQGVYSAKDFVYHYNLLPPFASQDFSTGKRVAVIGMGNVMVDIARWLILDAPDRQTQEVIVVARRGPFEAKFDDKEFEHIQAHLDRRAFADELRRVQPSLEAVGQDVTKVTEETFAVLKKHPKDGYAQPKLTFKFLCSPREIHAGPDGRIDRLVVTENELVARNGGTAAKATDKTFDLEVDTMIFAIGDTHDPMLGLPMGPEGYATVADPNDPKRPVFEVFDPQRGTLIEGTYVVGWARRASEGLVGIARHDGEVGAGFVLNYLERSPERMQARPSFVADYLDRRGVLTVSNEDILLLGQAEEQHASEQGVICFKFSDNESMLRAIEEQRLRAVASVRAA